MHYKLANFFILADGTVTQGEQSSQAEDQILGIFLYRPHAHFIACAFKLSWAIIILALHAETQKHANPNDAEKPKAMQPVLDAFKEQADGIGQ